MLPVPEDSAEAVEAVERLGHRRGKRRPNVSEAIQLVKLSAEREADAVLAEERASFQVLQLKEDAYALRHLFFSERAAGRVDGLDAKPAELTRIGIVGGGTMGQGIARATLVERDAEAAGKAEAAIAAALAAQVEKGRNTSETAEARAAGRSDQVRDALSRDLEAARYAADRAFRQYDAADPENRLVAAELEARWNQALIHIGEIESKIAAHDDATRPSPALATDITALATDLRIVWSAPTTDGP